jgi:uncharacterized phage-associated protein
MQYSYKQIAKEIIWFCIKSKLDLNGTKLSKLLYIFNAINLAFKGKSILQEKIVVCNYGPGVLESLKYYSPEMVLSPEHVIKKEDYKELFHKHSNEILDRETTIELHQCLEKFYPYTTFQLTELITNQHSLWNDVRKQEMYSEIDPIHLQKMADALFFNIFSFKPDSLRAIYLEKEKQNASN